MVADKKMNEEERKMWDLIKKYHGHQRTVARELGISEQKLRCMLKRQHIVKRWIAYKEKRAKLVLQLRRKRNYLRQNGRADEARDLYLTGQRPSRD